MLVYDITRELISAPAANGQPQTDLEWTDRIDCGEDYNISKLKLSSHAGTHLVAPKCYVDDGKSLTDYEAGEFYQPCTVVTIKGVLTGEDMESLLPLCKKQVLFKGDSQAVLSRSAAFVLADYGITLVGTDGPVIAFSQEGDQVYKELAISNILILQNADLSKISDGDYILTAMPLKVDGAEASPVRAALLAQEKGY